MGTNPQQRDWILCSKCRANISVVETDGDVQEIVIRIRAARKNAVAFPLNTNRQALEQEITSLVNPAANHRRTYKMVALRQKHMQQMFKDTMRQYRAHKWDTHMTAQAMGIKMFTLQERMRTYAAKGWITKKGKGWVRVVQP